MACMPLRVMFCCITNVHEPHALMLSELNSLPLQLFLLM